MSVIHTSSVTKSFGPVMALNDVSIHISKGEIYGFLGLNGAGKTTLIRTLLGMVTPDCGSIEIFGQKMSSKFHLWNDIGYMVEASSAYPDLTVRENLKIYYKLRRLESPEAIDTIIERLKLTSFNGVKAKHLSMGNQQRLGLAKSLMHKPRLLILDEPINGLDPEGIVEVREMLKELSIAGSTIFLSSHILGEIAKIADRVGIIHHGRLTKEIDAVELTSELIRKLIVNTRDNTRALEFLNTAGYRAQINHAGDLEFFDKEAISHPEAISELLVNHSLPPRKVYLFEEDLEKYFLRTIRSVNP